MAPSNLEHNHMRKREIIPHRFQGYFPRPSLSECSQMCFPVILQFSLEWWCMKAFACLLLSGQNATHFGAFFLKPCSKDWCCNWSLIGRNYTAVLWNMLHTRVTLNDFNRDSYWRRCSQKPRCDSNWKEWPTIFFSLFFVFLNDPSSSKWSFWQYIKKGKEIMRTSKPHTAFKHFPSSPGTFLSWRMVLCIPSWQKSEGLKIARNHSESSAFHMHA